MTTRVRQLSPFTECVSRGLNLGSGLVVGALPSQTSCQLTKFFDLLYLYILHFPYINGVGNKRQSNIHWQNGKINMYTYAVVCSMRHQHERISQMLSQESPNNLFCYLLMETVTQEAEQVRKLCQQQTNIIRRQLVPV